MFFPDIGISLNQTPPRTHRDLGTPFPLSPSLYSPTTSTPVQSNTSDCLLLDVGPPGLNQGKLYGINYLLIATTKWFQQIAYACGTKYLLCETKYLLIWRNYIHLVARRAKFLFQLATSQHNKARYTLMEKFYHENVRFSTFNWKNYVYSFILVPFILYHNIHYTVTCFLLLKQ